MKRVLAAVIVVIVGVAFIWLLKNDKKNNNFTPNSSTTISTAKVTAQKNAKNYLFVPYWTVSNNMDLTSFDSLIYFGLNVNDLGIDTDDNGYKNLDTFIENVPSGREKILAITITDPDTVSDILKDKNLQDKIINESTSLAKEKDFDGVLLDFETSAFAFQSTTDKISNFYIEFSKQAHQNNLLFYATLFGDTYFRARAYDVAKIGKASDKVLVMAYDFTKARSNPGPDFPLMGRDKYGYDMGQMVSDFQKDVTNEKLVITLGYFGYDWMINNKNDAISSGIPLSTNKIEQDLVNTCNYENCSLKRSDSTGEPSITYIDGTQKHVVWFEDNISIAKKKEFLKSKGIKSIGIWAYSYF